MKNILFLFPGFLFFFSVAEAQFSYVYPVPGSVNHKPQTTIILRNGALIDRSSLDGVNWIEIKGSKSGTHESIFRLSDDEKTIVVKPVSSFEFDETIFVTIHPGIHNTEGKIINGLNYSFSTRKKPTAEEVYRFRESDLEVMGEEFGFNQHNYEMKKSLPLDSIASFTVNVYGNASPGYVFFNSQNQYYETNTNSVAVMLQSNGTVVWARDLGIDGHDFKLNWSGYITYYEYTHTRWIVLDSNMKVIDSIRCKNGYEDETNGHDIMWYPDDHVFLLAYDNQTIDMSLIVPGGQPDATVKGLIIQELDANRDVVFEWRSWDHFEITDAVSSVALTNGIVDYCHGNSVERDGDGNLIISSRNMCEITKINHETGNIMWRMGGENNEFTFIDDNIPEHFSYQHDARRTFEGTLTLYNNGNYLVPQRSSAKEYELDEVSKTATLVWYYEHPDVNGQMVYGRASGNVQRLWNGYTFIDWGNPMLFSDGLPNFTEVDKDKNIVWELSFDTAVWMSYRAHRYVWEPCARVTWYNMFADVKFNKVILSWSVAAGAKSYELNYRKLGEETWTVLWTPQAKVTFTTLEPLTTYEWRVETICSNMPSIRSGFTPIATFTTMAKVGLDESYSVNVFPNPCGNQLEFSLESMPDFFFASQIMNMLGETVHEEIIYPWQPFTINTAELRAGTYILRILNAENTSVTSFVKE